MKHFLIGVLFFCLVIPQMAFGGGAAAPSTDELLQRIEELSKELQRVKQQLKEVKAKQDEQEEVADTVEELAEKMESVAVDGTGRFDLSGDYRFRLDSTRAHIKGFWDGKLLFSPISSALNTFSAMDAQTLGTTMQPALASLPQDLQVQLGQLMGVWDQLGEEARKAALFSMLGALNDEARIGLFQLAGIDPNDVNAAKFSSRDIRNDTLYTNRLRFNIQVKATENIKFKGRLAMYKVWGMETSSVTAVPFGMNGFIWDPNISRRPNDNTLRVEMAYVNFTNIFGLPMWISVGRRPTVDGPPLQLKYNYDKRYATPVALGVDWTFDGATIGYMYTDPWPGKIRVCYGRGYESGFGDAYDLFGGNRLDDTDLYGISWDVINDPDREMFANIQLFRAADVPNYMEFYSLLVVNPADPNNALNNMDFLTNGLFKGYQVGDIYHASGVFMHKFRGIDYFISAGLSRTDSNFVDPTGLFPGLLNAPGENDNHWGWAAYVGVRIPVEQLNSKIGLEYNHGSRYWINFTPAADDLYLSKLATRGDVAEVYWIWDIPDTPLSKYGKAFMRFGYQYYWIDYTGSGNWMGKPVDMDDLDNMLNAQQFAPVDRMDNFYMTFEVYF
ncbi:hypothetical protein DBT_2228 [Dissulfuribacter thermophilus]|uniref:DUF3373 domain-containing protein n=1 Tax=Dissulfuribacter thermophilus TaxID=1156395 RepID=A0A1B9F3F8_9BACT|nr:DUF3373 family protein [Dissulfuribacter thermophilus]OCC14355.1 hypothetical protein DBT_2228 [Dissulfuribacter thermophilus]